MNKVWDELLGLQDARYRCNSMKEWMLQRFTKKIGTETRNEIRWQTTPTTGWTIWKGKCFKVFEGKQPDPRVGIASVRKSL